MMDPGSFSLAAVDALPVGTVLSEIVEASRAGPVVVAAPPGSGKTMLVPPAILDDLSSEESVFLLQPRRLAARSVASQLARLRQGRLGGEVGYQVRFDTKVSQETRLFVQTTGVLLRRLLDDVSLETVGGVILDEFHERTTEMDLILGMLIRLRQTVRPDLRILVMSATLETEPVAARLGGAAVITATGRPFPVDVRYLKRGRSPTHPRDLPAAVERTISDALRSTDGHVLVFLPGVGEIHATARLLEPIARAAGHRVLQLFGDLPPERQDEVLEEHGCRKIILATNVAETSLTIPGVTAVIDGGLARQVQVTPATGLPQLVTVPISVASAEQRAGRAGRTGPGICWRLWEEAAHHRRPPAETPEVLRSDLVQASLLLATLGEGDEFPWLDQPPAAMQERAHLTLSRLGCVAEPAERSGAGTATVMPRGRTIVGLPAHPRLAALLVAGAEQGVLREAAVAAALLSERDPFRAGGQQQAGPRDRIQQRTRSDVYDRVLAIQHFYATGNAAGVPGLGPLHAGAARGVLRAADQFYRLVENLAGPRAEQPEEAFRRVLLAAFPDRVCRLRAGSSDRGAMVGGRGVRLDRASRVRQEPYFLAVDIDDASSEVKVRLASAIESAWLLEDAADQPQVRRVDEVAFNTAKKRVEARRRICWFDLALDETPLAIPDAAEAMRVLVAEAARSPAAVMPATDTAAGSLLARARWLATVGDQESSTDLIPPLPPLGDEELLSRLPECCHGLNSFAELRQADWLGLLKTLLGYEVVSAVNRLAPEYLALATGSTHAIDYASGSQPRVSIRIQELFGTAATPRIVAGRVPLLVQLLGPNHRPQQLTTDLASFWATTYPEVKKELKRRYPKHAWPDDPLAAAPIRSGLKRDAT